MKLTAEDIQESDQVMELHIPGQTSKYFLLRFVERNYQQQISINNFRRREMKRAFPAEIKDGVIKLSWFDYARTIKYCADFARGKAIALHIKHEFIPEITAICNSPYELYDAIGYDRKKKRYIE